MTTSLVIRKSLDFNRRKLSKALTTLPKCDEHVRSIDELDSRKLSVRIALKTLTTKVQLLREKNEEWMKLMNEMSGEKREKEEELYESYTSKPGNFLEVVSEAEDSMSYLEARLIETIEVGERLTKLNASHNISLTEPIEPKANITLPAISLPKFDGNPLEYKSFWDQYDNLVHQQNLANVTKLTHLLSTLHGKAKAALEGLPVTNASYNEAIEILRNRFGDVNVVRRALYVKIQNLPKCDKTTESIACLTENLDKLCRQLKAVGEDPDHPAILLGIQQKLSPTVLENITQSKPAAQQWTMSGLQAALENYIKMKEEVQNILNVGETQPATRRITYTNQVTTAPYVKRQAESRDPAPKSCELCTEHHFADACMNYLRTDDRRNRLTYLQRCFRCLKNGHQSNRCQYTRPCYFCTGNHHQALCTRREPVNNSWQSRQPERRQANMYPSKGGFTRTNQMTQQDTSYQYRPEPGRPSRQGGDGWLSPQQNWTTRQPTEKRTNATMESTRERSNANQSTQLASNTHIITSKNSGLQANTATTTDWVDELTVELPTGKHREKLEAKDVYLMTIDVELSNPNSEQERGYPATALLDSGSQRTFISEEMVKKMQLSSVLQQVLSLNTFASKKSRPVDSKLVELQITMRDGTKKIIQANSISFLTNELQRKVPIKCSQNKAWETSEEEVIPDLLIGADYLWDFMKGSEIEKLPGGLYRISTNIGDGLSGHLRAGVTDGNSTELPIKVTSDNSEKHAKLDKLPTNVEDFWNLESMGIKDNPSLSDDDNALQQFEKTVSKKGNRYEVGWPWKGDEKTLTNNYGLSMGRLKTLLKRLRTDETLFERYNETITKQEELGIIERVDHFIPQHRPVYYIPHQPVITPFKATTKLRVVYDASSKASKKEVSLNEAILRGPPILPQLCGMLLRFRLSPIIITADIEKAFLQVSLREEDRDTTRFLWVKDRKYDVSKNNTQVYRFARLPFGVVASPFLLATTIRYHLDSVVNKRTELNTTEKDDLKRLIDEVRANMYVDNIMIGADTIANAEWKYQRLKKIFQNASMNLREWISNDDAVNERFDHEDRIEGNMSKILGHLWNVKDDLLQIQLKETVEAEMEVLTKRKVLNQLASNFDPLGLLSPVILCGKLFIRKLWNEKLGWDEVISDNRTIEWRVMMAEWKRQTKFQIPRLIRKNKAFGPITLHAFVDASKVAYATCIYLREGKATEDGLVHLIYAKNRLSPTKTVTIPRLELLAALIGHRAVRFVEEELGIKVDRKIVWCDAKCVLTWISSRKALPVFISNRVREIREDRSIEYRYVRTTENPADIATRGANPEELSNHVMWWNGPIWLRQSEVNWPPEDEDREISEDEELGQPSEIGNLVENNVNLINDNRVIVAQEEDVLERLTERVNTWRKLKGAVAYILRWIKRGSCSPVNSKDQLSVDELEEAEMLILQRTQDKYFREIHQAIEAKTRHQVKDQLGIQLINGILRCVGRYERAKIEENARAPILIPSKGRITELIVNEAHHRSLHNGLQFTLCTVRQKYWIPKGRATVKRIIRACKLCKRNEGGPFALPPMPALPRMRTTRTFPFQHTGLDYFGPLEVKDGEVNRKIWGCLWTCLNTRAVHIDVVTNLTAETFLNAFQRFIARRGIPSVIISDNATTFTAGSRALLTTTEGNEWETGGIQLGRDLGIKWQFITSHAPWKGGVYERIIGLIKRTMRKTIGRRILTIEHMTTFLCEVEAVLNSRPLTYLYEEPDGRIIRPIDFILPHVNLQLPPTETSEDDEDTEFCLPRERDLLVEQYIKGLKVLDKFWQIWHNEYFLSLRETQRMLHVGKHAEVKREPEIGEVVLIHEEDLPRGQWKLGRIVTIGRSTDDHIRTAYLKTMNREKIERPLNKLYPLEVRSEEREPHQNLETSEPLMDDLAASNEEEMNTEASMNERPDCPKFRANEADTNLQMETTEERDEHSTESDDNVRRRVKSHDSGRKKEVKISTKLILAVAFIGMMLSTSVSAQLRCDHKGGTLIRLPTPHGCPDFVNGVTKEIEVNVATRQYIRQPAIMCSKLIHTVCTKAFLRLILTVSRDERAIRATTTIECWKLWKDKQLEGIRLFREDSGKWKSRERSSYSFGWLGERCYTITNFIVERGDLLYHNGTHIISPLASVEQCEMKKGSCRANHATYVWHVSNSSECNYRSRGTYKARFIGDHCLIDELQLAIVVKKYPLVGKGICNKEATWMSTNGEVMLSMKKNQTSKLEVQGMTGNKLSPVLLMEKDNDVEDDRENRKLQFLYDKLILEIQERTVENWRRICHHDDTIIRLVRQVARTNPVEAAKLILNRDDVTTAKIRRDKMIVRCAGSDQPRSGKWSINSTLSEVIFNASMISEEQRTEVLLQQISNYQKSLPEMSEGGNLSNEEEDDEEFLEEVGGEFEKTIEDTEEQIMSIVSHWKLGLIALTTILLIVGAVAGLIYFQIFCGWIRLCPRKSRRTDTDQICMRTMKSVEQKPNHRELLAEIDESRELQQISSKPPLWHNVKAIKLLQISTNHDNQTTEL